MTVHVLLEDSFDGHQGNDLYDPEHVINRAFRVRKQATVHEFLELLSDSLVSEFSQDIFCAFGASSHAIISLKDSSCAYMCVRIYLQSKSILV